MAMVYALRTMSLTKAPRSRLLDLPPELRDLVFEYALISDTPLVTFRLDSYQRESMCEAVQPNLTLVSRQVRGETLPIWYGCNRFVLHTEEARAREAQKWLLCNELHLPLLKGLSLWVRYVNPLNDRSYGAIGIKISRSAGQPVWDVQPAWDWITVVRKPTALENDADLLRAELRVMLATIFQPPLKPETWYCLLLALRMRYVDIKSS